MRKIKVVILFSVVLLLNSCVSKQKFTQLEIKYEELARTNDKLVMDDDNDGVSNFFDKEANTPQGVEVGGAGMALDLDKDGVPDYMDEDPFTAKGAQVSNDGRALDSDGDGVPDFMDKEPNTLPNTPVGVNGVSIVAETVVVERVSTTRPLTTFPKQELNKVKQELKNLNEKLNLPEVQLKQSINANVMAHLSYELRENEKSELVIIILKDKITNDLLSDINEDRKIRRQAQVTLKQIKDGKIKIGDYFKVQAYTTSSLVKVEMLESTDSSFSEMKDKIVLKYVLIINEDAASRVVHICHVKVKSIFENNRSYEELELKLPFIIKPSRDAWDSFVNGFSGNPLLYITSICSFLAWIANFIMSRRKKIA